MRAAKFVLQGQATTWTTSLSSRKTIIKQECNDHETKTNITSRARVTVDYDMQSCEVCLDDLGVHHLPTMPQLSQCTHEVFTICIDCLATHIDEQAGSVSPSEVPCPEPGCNAHLSYEQMDAFASETVSTRYRDYFGLKTIAGIPWLRQMCKPILSSGACVESDDGVIPQYFTSEDCKARTCISCATLFHLGVLCEDNMAKVRQEEAEEAQKFEAELQRMEIEDQAAQAALADRKMGEESKTAAKMTSFGKKCPGEGCIAWIRKSDGCDHMTCKCFGRPLLRSMANFNPGKICKHQFCWICLEDHHQTSRDASKHKPTCPPIIGQFSHGPKRRRG